VRFSPLQSGSQAATLCRAEGRDARTAGDEGQKIVEHAPVSMGVEARITEGGDHRFFAGWRSDPFFFDRRGAINNLQFTGGDFFADKNVCSMVLEVPNSALPPKAIGLWHRTLLPSNGSGESWVQVERGRFNSSWFSDCPLRRVMPTIPANLQTTPSSFLPSRTRWSTRATLP
jgi:hypothetical protein